MRTLELDAVPQKFNRLEWQKKYRRNNKNASTKNYEKTKSGKLMRTYRNMFSRVSGVLKTKIHLYGGLSILTKDEFYDWSLRDENFNTLYKDWVESNYSHRLSPSIDRINTSFGYDLGNIRCITHSENSRNGGFWKKHG